jgi:flap endonuclease-1
MKGGELAKRADKRKDATEGLKAAEEGGTAEDVEKFTKRLVKVTKQHNEDCKKLLTMMGIPHITAPCEVGAPL